MSFIFNNGPSCSTCNQNGKNAVILYITVPGVRVSRLNLVHIKMEAKTQTKLKIKCSTKMGFLFFFSNGLKFSFIWCVRCWYLAMLWFALLWKPDNSVSVFHGRGQPQTTTATDHPSRQPHPAEHLISIQPTSERGFYISKQVGFS